MDYIKLLSIILVLLLFLAIWIWNFITKSKEEKEQILIDSIIFWARAAVYRAEEEFGGGTGELKLASVYNEALKQFPIIAEIFTAEDFNNKIVKPALLWLNKQMSSNENIKQLLGISPFKPKK